MGWTVSLTVGSSGSAPRRLGRCRPAEDRRATREELEAERDRLVGLGASMEKLLTEPWGPFEQFAIMMRDPEGNEFCLQ